MFHTSSPFHSLPAFLQYVHLIHPIPPHHLGASPVLWCIWKLRQSPHTSTPFGSFASPLVHMEASLHLRCITITYGVKVYWHQRCKKEGLANVHLYTFTPLHLYTFGVSGERSGMGCIRCNPNGVAWHGEDDCQYTKGVKKLAVGAKSGGQFSDATPQSAKRQPHPACLHLWCIGNFVLAVLYHKEEKTGGCAPLHRRCIRCNPNGVAEELMRCTWCGTK